MTGMIDFFGFEIFDSGIFLGRKMWQVFFLVALFKYGLVVVPVYLGRLVFVVSMLYHLMRSGSFKASKIQRGIFL